MTAWRRENRAEYADLAATIIGVDTCSECPAPIVRRYAGRERYTCSGRCRWRRWARRRREAAWAAARAHVTWDPDALPETVYVRTRGGCGSVTLADWALGKRHTLDPPWRPPA